MAILWQKTIDNTKYEVRTAGNTRRLYTDGVFHSQYNPSRAVTGGIWDLLTLPALFYPAESIQRVLLLGVGGGAAIHQLQHYIKPGEITGIELNPVHIMLAKRFFGVSQQQVQLVHADAVEWLENYSGPAFDMIIEDLFTEEKGEPVRAVKANKAWFATLNKNLNEDGLLVMNFISHNDLKNCAAVSYKKISNFFNSSFEFSLNNYENAIGAFLKIKATSPQLQKKINMIDGFSKKVEFKVKKIK